MGVADTCDVDLSFSSTHNVWFMLHIKCFCLKPYTFSVVCRLKSNLFYRDAPALWYSFKNNYFEDVQFDNRRNILNKTFTEGRKKCRKSH